MLVQIFASSACDRRGLHDRRAERLEQPRGALAGAVADAADDARQRPDLLQEAVGGDPLRHVRDEHVLADGEAALLLQVAGDELGRAGRDGRAQHEQLAGRAAPAAGRRAPTRMSPMSISMCDSVGVPSVSTIASACAASAARGARRRASTRASSSSVPGSLNGIRRERTASSRSASLSMPSTRRPASANASASGRPTRPRPMTETSYTAPGTLAAPRGAAAPTGGRSRRRSAGCSAGSAATAGAAPGRAGTAHSRPSRCIQPGACGIRPAWKSNAAPTPTSTGASSRCAHPRHPLLLLRDADPDPHDVGAGAA